MNRITFDGRPKVVGTLSSLESGFHGGCDIVEVRLDKTRPADWLERCADLDDSGVPVLLTVRLRAEGGEWETDDDARLRIYEKALTKVSAVDVELRSAICAKVAEAAERLGKTCIVSYHDFVGTPLLKELATVVERAHRLGSVAKISTLIRNHSDLSILESLLRTKWEKPLCVIGMGEEWRETRVSFPKLGSCLTYGYLDKSAAPGQWFAPDLKARLLL